MKVLMFGWEFPPYISGGLGTACYGLTQSLANQEVQILFVLPRVDGESESHSPVELIAANKVAMMLTENETKTISKTLKLIEVSSILQPYLNEKSYREVFKKWYETQTVTVNKGHGVIEIAGDYGSDLLGEVYRYSLIGAHLGKNQDFDVIHAHDWMTFPAAVLAKETSGKALIVHVHSTEFDRSGEFPNPDIYDMERRGMDAADRIVAVSNRTRNIILKRYGQPSEKVLVIHNGITKEEPISEDKVVKGVREKIVLFLGRITMQKGPDYFVEAACKVWEKMENVRFVMAGSGDMLPRLIERVAALRMQDRFHFTGFLRGERREKIFAMSDVYVMPSVSEPFGLTPLEALKYGVPLILSKQSGVTEILENAIKVDFWDIDSLSKKIIDVLTRPDLQAHLVAQSTLELEKIDWNLPAERISDLYRDLSMK